MVANSGGALAQQGSRWGISTSPTCSIYLSVRNQTTQPSAATITTTVLQTMLREAAAAINHVQLIRTTAKVLYLKWTLALVWTRLILHSWFWSVEISVSHFFKVYIEETSTLWYTRFTFASDLGSMGPYTAPCSCWTYQRIWFPFFLELEYYPGNCCFRFDLLSSPRSDSQPLFFFPLGFSIWKSPLFKVQDRRLNTMIFAAKPITFWLDSDEPS